MTALELRHTAPGYPETPARAAVAAGLAECLLPDVPAEPDFPNLVTFWLLDPAAWEWSPPPLPRNTLEAIYRRLVASAN
jgi:hypothetical protein